jgi:hypothetical protein
LEGADFGGVAIGSPVVGLEESSSEIPVIEPQTPADDRVA